MTGPTPNAAAIDCSRINPNNLLIKVANATIPATSIKERDFFLFSDTKLLIKKLVTIIKDFVIVSKISACQGLTFCNQ